MTAVADKTSYRTTSGPIQVSFDRAPRVRFGMMLLSLKFIIGSIFEPLDDEFSEFEAYGVPNWDGYHAAPISKDTVDAARRFNSQIPRSDRMPDVAPGADGTIGFEWRFGPSDSRDFVLVDIGPGDRVTGRKIFADGRVETAGPTKIGAGSNSLIRTLLP
jgi:hypothetical protein